MAAYAGVQAPLAFANPRDEFAALRGGCAVLDLSWRAKLVVSGEDRTRWLNGMVTNNIRDLAQGHGVYSFLLNPQGHILGDLYAYNRGESITIDTDRSQLEKTLATFEHYIIMDDVEVTNLSEQLTALGVAGPKSRKVLRAAGLEFPELQPGQLHTVQCDCDCSCLTCTIVRAEEAPGESYEVWLAPDQVRPLWDALRRGGAAPVGSETLELQRIISGIPRYGVDIRERDLPQETEQARALNFNKGCYIGQEIVERIRSRGAVHRKFTGFLAQGAGQIVPGAKILAGEKEAGEITSAASLRLENGEETVALGYIRREAGVPGREVTIGTVRATVIQLPVEDAVLAESSLARHQA